MSQSPSETQHCFLKAVVLLGFCSIGLQERHIGKLEFQEQQEGLSFLPLSPTCGTKPLILLTFRLF